MKRPSFSNGFATFTVIWSGQLASLLGTGLTRFALILWLYEQTGQATSIALLGFFRSGLRCSSAPLPGWWRTASTGVGS
ncbi:MAG: hypothetical protein ETSY1_14855 [Candidatus Entotheonella factor]|uniref:Uncharacterized protein n=1 Tax=Entotheonella factor TaxID=1429438 RepID=W4LN24_ENTF1|nr:MAG: hypothetical protein ETSY1_14855 [Candidatus Entotheonella factor]